jgi:hypothetical protein
LEDDVGGLISSIYDLASGDPAKAQENQLGALGGYETNVGQNLTNAGAGFDEAILSGDATRTAQALAPEISAGKERVQQDTKTNAEFGTRSGGTAASTANAQDAERSNIVNLVGGLQQGAAGQALNAGGNLLNQASGNINDVAGMNTARQKTVTGDVGGIAEGVAEMFTGEKKPKDESTGSSGWTGGGEAGPSGFDSNVFEGNAGLDLSMFA